MGRKFLTWDLIPRSVLGGALGDQPCTSVPSRKLSDWISCGIVDGPERYKNSRREGNDQCELINLVIRLRIWNNNRGQDFIEYSLITGFMAVAAAVISPNISSSVSAIFTTLVAL